MIYDIEKVCRNCEYSNQRINNKECLRSFTANKILPVKDPNTSCKYFSASNDFLILKSRQEKAARGVGGYG